MSRCTPALALCSANCNVCLHADGKVLRMLHLVI
jgi:hypothetical protein